MSYAKSLGKEEEKRYADALKSGSAVTYVDEEGERQKGTAVFSDMAEGYKTIYDEQVAANNAAAESAAAQAQNRLESGTATLNEEYGLVNKGLYRQYRKALQSLPQELAAMGYTGGESETSRVELERSYEENVGGSERERLSALTALREEEAEARRKGQETADKANADARREYLNALIALREKAYGDERDRAEELAAAGDFSGYEKLGYSSEEIELLRHAWEAANPELAIGIAARGGRYSADEVATMPAAWVQQYLNALGYALKVNGSWNSATENAYKAVFGKSSGRYTSLRYYGVKKEEEEEKKTDGNRSGSAGAIRVSGSTAVGGGTGGSAGGVTIRQSS